VSLLMNIHVLSLSDLLLNMWKQMGFEYRFEFEIVYDTPSRIFAVFLSVWHLDEIVYITLFCTIGCFPHTIPIRRILCQLVKFQLGSQVCRRKTSVDKLDITKKKQKGYLVMGFRKRNSERESC